MCVVERGGTGLNNTIINYYYYYGVINSITTIGILWPSEIVRIPDIVRFWPIDGIRTISGPLAVLN